MPRSLAKEKTFSLHEGPGKHALTTRPMIRLRFLIIDPLKTESSYLSIPLNLKKRLSFEGKLL